MDKLKIALGISLGLVVIMAGMGAYLYVDLQNQILTLKDENSSLHDQIDPLYNEKISLESQVSQLEADKTGLENQISSKDSQILSLSSQIISLQSPNLLKINLGEGDNRPGQSAPYLRVQAVIVNLGINTAYNCKLHVILYQGSVAAIDTDIMLDTMAGGEILGTIAGGEWVTVDERIFYTGSALTSWSVMPEWTVTPAPGDLE